MPEDKTIKDMIKLIDKDFVQAKKKIQEFTEIVDRIDKDYAYVVQMKSESQISKSYMADIKSNISKLDILENSYNFERESNDLMQRINQMNVKAKEMSDFFETFRTVRLYDIKDENKIFRFLSGFLDGFSEYYEFKPEFMGTIDLSTLAKEINGVKDGAKIKLPYDSLPKVIKKAYESNLTNFVIEANRLKMSFYKDYKIKIIAESSMIKNIDKVARECDIILHI